MRQATVGVRVRRRLRSHSRGTLLSMLGRPLRCAECGEVIARVVPTLGGGRVRLIGLEFRNVRVSFSGPEVIEFRHAELDRCPSSERPWVARSAGP